MTYGIDYKLFEMFWFNGREEWIAWMCLVHEKGEEECEREHEYAQKHLTNDNFSVLKNKIIWHIRISWDTRAEHFSKTFPAKHITIYVHRHKLHQFDGDMEMNCKINWGRTSYIGCTSMIAIKFSWRLERMAASMSGSGTTAAKRTNQLAQFEQQCASESLNSIFVSAIQCSHLFIYI